MEGYATANDIDSAQREQLNKSKSDTAIAIPPKETILTYFFVRSICYQPPPGLPPGPPGPPPGKLPPEEPTEVIMEDTVKLVI